MIDLTFNGKDLGFNGKNLAYDNELPPFTMRLRYIEGYIPTTRGTMVQLSTSPNIWDMTYENPDWSGMFDDSRTLIEVIAANTTGVTDMSYMFQFNQRALTTVCLFDTSSVTDMHDMFKGCPLLTSVPLFDTSSCTIMTSMFNGCGSLTFIPLFDTSKCTDMRSMFQDCYNVRSGALALYRQASSQATYVVNHSSAFTNCGINTTTGLAELRQIPTSWGGEMT